MAAAGGYVAGHFALELGGKPAGFAMSVSGGERFAPVVRTGVNGRAIDKAPGTEAFAPLVIEVDHSSPDVVSWVAKVLAGKQTAMDGTIGFLDYNYHELTRLDWTGGMLAEIVFPPADTTTAKANGAMTITIVPQATTQGPGRGPRLGSFATAKGHKAWVTANFRWSIQQLENACSKASSVGRIVARPQADGSIEIDDVDVVVSAAVADQFRTWLDRSLQRGGDERTASLSWLDASLKSELLRLDLGGVGVSRVRGHHDRATTSAGRLPQATVTCYVETLDLVVPASAPESAPDGGGAAQGVGTGAGSTTSARESKETSTGQSREAIAARLTKAADATPSSRGVDGREVGGAWAAEVARRGELEALAALAGREDWSAVAVDADHSLVAFLQARGILEENLPAPSQLDRDEFVAAVVAGAADVYREVAPLLSPGTVLPAAD